MNAPTVRQRTLIVALVALLSYAAAIPSGFAFDDTPVLLDNPVIQGKAPLREVFVRDWWGHVAAQTVGSYRPLAALSLWADWRVGGWVAAHSNVPRAWPMHLVNVLLHALAMALLYRVLRGLASEVVAFAAALLCAVVAAPSEVVQGLVGRADLLETIGLLAGLQAHRRPGFRQAVIACGCFLLALGSKETGILAVIAWPAMELFVPADNPWTWRWGRLAGYAGATAGYLAFRRQAVGSLQLPHNAGSMFNPLYAADTVSRVFGAGHIFLYRYALGILDPRRRLYDCSAQACTTSTPADWVAWGGILLFAAMLVAPLILRRREPVVAAGLAWTAIFLAPVANFFVPATLTYGERLLYVPMLGLTLAAAAWAARARLAGWIVLTVVGLVNVALLQPRHWDWRSNETLAASGLRYAADSVVVQENNAAAATDRKDFAAAEAFAKRAVELVPEDEYAHGALAVAYAGEGRRDLAEAEFRKSLALTRRTDILRKFVNLLAKEGRYPEAITEVERQMHEHPLETDLQKLIDRLRRAEQSSADAKGE